MAGARLRPISMSALLQPALRGLDYQAEASGNMARAITGAGAALGGALKDHKRAAEDKRRDERDFGESQRRFETQAGFEERRLGLAENEQALRYNAANTDALDKVANADAHTSAASALLSQLQAANGLGVQPDESVLDRLSKHVESVGGAAQAGALSVFQQDNGGMLPSSVVTDRDALSAEMARDDEELGIATMAESEAFKALKYASGASLVKAKKLHFDASAKRIALQAKRWQTERNLRYAEKQHEDNAKKQQEAADAAHDKQRRVESLDTFKSALKAAGAPDDIAETFGRAYVEGGIKDIEAGVRLWGGEESRAGIAGQRETTNEMARQRLELAREGVDLRKKGFARSGEWHRDAVARGDAKDAAKAKAAIMADVTEAAQGLLAKQSQFQLTPEAQQAQMDDMLSTVSPDIARELLAENNIDTNTLIGRSLARRVTAGGGAVSATSGGAKVSGAPPDVVSKVRAKEQELGRPMDAQEMREFLRAIGAVK